MGRSERGMLRSIIVTAVFTGVLTLLAAIQAYSFIESERAFLVLKSIELAHKEPITGNVGIADGSGLDVIITIRNVGKHVASVSAMKAQTVISVTNQPLPDTPNIYVEGVNLPVAPIPPESDIPFNLHNVAVINLSPEFAHVANGINNGTVPFWVYGFVHYDVGYPWWHRGELGFCMKYVARINRAVATDIVLTCDKQNCTYVR